VDSKAFFGSGNQRVPSARKSAVGVGERSEEITHRLMTQVAFSSSFKRAFKKRIAGRKELETKFWQRVEIFTAKPHDSRLRTHKLSGELREQWSFTIEYNV
jgi:mRNA-degrading endonuclease YafQ of YafQ-DinJ toxin-antitoxin module